MEERFRDLAHEMASIPVLFYAKPEDVIALIGILGDRLRNCDDVLLKDVADSFKKLGSEQYFYRDADLPDRYLPEATSIDAAFCAQCVLESVSLGNEEVEIEIDPEEGGGTLFICVEGSPWQK